jgi:hypothetical protein
MSDTIEVSRVLQFKSNVLHLYQQDHSKLKGLVREEVVNAKAHFFERLARTAAVRRTVRHGDTPLVNSQHSRRMVTMVDYEWADLVDNQDKIRLLITPESEYAINAAAAMKRAFDYEVVLAMDADAKSGEDGSTAVTFSTEGLDDDDNSGGAVTTAQIMTFKLAFDKADIPADNRTVVTGSALISQLLTASSAPLAASSDYNTIKALVGGSMDTWAGWKFVQVNDNDVMPLLDTNDKYAFFFHKDAMGIARGQEIMTKIDPRVDKSYAVQVYLCQTLGATRIQPGVARMRYNSNLA